MKRVDLLFKASKISRGKGQSVVERAAFNARDSLINELTGERYDYRCKYQILFAAIFSCKETPEWAQYRQSLWSEAERAATLRSSTLAQEIEISMPDELSESEHEHLVKEFVREQYVRRGIVADVCIHAPDCPDNSVFYHAHILLPLRAVGEEGFGAKLHLFSDKMQIQKWRNRWKALVAEYLDRHGYTRLMKPFSHQRKAGSHRAV